MRAFTALLSACALLACPFLAVAQDTTSPAQTESPAPAWEGLPFTSLADYEIKVPIGMSRRDVTRTLGQPEMTMPGQGSDQVFHYGYQLTDGRQIRAVIILRDGAVFIRRLSISTATGETQRAN